MVVAFESVDDVRKCDHSNESYHEYFLWSYLVMRIYKMVLTFEFVVLGVKEFMRHLR